MKKRLTLGVALAIFALIQTPPQTAATASLRFEITVARGLIASPQSGRLFVMMNRNAQPEPRLTATITGVDAPPRLGRDVGNFAPGVVGVIDENAAAFPIEDLAHLPAGDYFVQAVFDSNIDLKSVNAPGNLYSAVQKVRLDPARPATVKIELTQKVPPEQTPAETEYVRYVKIQSDLLSKFHGRPIYLRAGVILPKGYDEDASRRYPLRVSIGGYGVRFTAVQRMMSAGSDFRKTWLADDAPRMVLLHLDGDGPYGDCYQVNSDNNGPYGDALTQELIPYVEQKFRCVGQPYARVLEGGSTGGWVSLALQVFYPDFFNGAWSGYPDGVDFHAFQLIDIYRDDNAYVNAHGFERPSERDLKGDVNFTVRHECRMENVLGAGDSWAMSGQQWGAWNATYGPRGADGCPVALWDPKTGKINRGAVEHWKKYDLRLVMERNWKTLGPKLRGKITVWVGDADEYFLNNAVHLLDEFLSKADPAYGGKIIYGAGKGHGWMALSERRMMDEMAAAIEKARH
ncbi:MAG TPA: alpha/beta hydrolase-fold protein [Blastocatellia bacterium]|jgi:S-formylglutathione hydrolase FrmB|nr:alpha/beta hydrolase-fold protein [Blastocatellia bacterium]